MKKLIFGLLIASTMGFFFACQNNDVLQDEEIIQQIMDSSAKQAITQSDISEEMQSYMETEYAYYLTEEAYHVAGKGYELQLESGINVYFNERNRCLGNRPHPRPRFRCLHGDTIDLADLPVAITDFVASNVPNETIDLAVQKPFGLYAVELSNGAILIFDEDGEYLSRCGQWGGPGHQGRRCMQGMEVDVAGLPTAIADYVAANYVGETIDKASTKPNGIFAVKLSGGAVLLFNADGEFIRECRS